MNEKKKDSWITGAAVYAVIIVLGLFVVFAIMYGARLFSNATTPIQVEEVEPGVHCATMVTADGAAIDCWKVDD